MKATGVKQSGKDWRRRDVLTDVIHCDTITPSGGTCPNSDKLYKK